jgi:collagenase-like PrtC family protease
MKRQTVRENAIIYKQWKPAIKLDAVKHTIKQTMKKKNAVVEGCELKHDEIKHALDYAKERGKKLYVAMNVAILAEKIAQLREKRIAIYVNWGVDGVIIKEAAFMDEVRKEYPDWDIVASVGL